jgi:phosphatidylglycerophosphatase C
MSHSENQKQLEIVAFDFDGTLIKSDSMRDFLLKTYGVWPLLKVLAKSPALIMGMIAQSTRGSHKWEIISPIIGPITAEALNAKAYDFFHKHSKKLWRIEALKAWNDHKAKGRVCVIISGSLRPILEPFADYLGAEALICTEVGYSDKGIMPVSENCVGPEKLARLKASYGHGVRIHSAYGDTKGDYEMLAAAQHAFYRRFK